MSRTIQVATQGWKIRLLGKKFFELSDHLGNVTMTVSDRKQLGGSPGGYGAQVLSYEQYYPFGSTQGGRGVNSVDYRFGFNGKEDDKEWGASLVQDYGFRLYNPGIGRFLSVDPLAAHYPHYTPYQFAGNTPIQAVDLDGLEDVYYGNLPGDDGTTKPRILHVEDNYSVVEMQPGLDNYSNQVVIQNYIRVNKSYDDYFYNTFILPQQKAAEQKRKEAQQKRVQQDLMALRAKNNNIFYLMYEISPLSDGVAIYEQVDAGNYGTAAGLTALSILPGELDDLVARKALKAEVGIGVKVIDDVIPCGCFTAGTKIKTETGVKDIEQIKIDDWVWAYNDSTEIKALKQVKQLYTYERDSIFWIYTSDEIIKTTSDHPFYTRGEYYKVEDLDIGDTLLLLNGEVTTIDSISIEFGRYQVYNFMVDDYHNYFVGINGILVHNSGPCPWTIGSKDGATTWSRKGQGFESYIGQKDDIVGGSFKFGDDLPEIDFFAEISVSGDRISLTDFAVYPANATGNELAGQYGTRAMLKSLGELKNWAKERGYKELRVQGVRADNSSSANPGMVIDRVFKLE